MLTFRVTVAHKCSKMTLSASYRPLKNSHAVLPWLVRSYPDVDQRSNKVQKWNGLYNYSVPSTSLYVSSENEEELSPGKGSTQTFQDFNLFQHCNILSSCTSMRELERNKSFIYSERPANRVHLTKLYTMKNCSRSFIVPILCCKSGIIITQAWE